MANKKETPRQSFSYYLDRIAATRDKASVFHDFLTIIVCSLSWGMKEELYLSTVKRYSKEEVELFVQAFAALVISMQEHPLEDQLGDYFQTYISRGHNGQFFTPTCICDFMASILKPKDTETVCDPTCGSGRFFLATAKVSRNRTFFGADISEDCCLMTLINMCLNDLTGEVWHMNTISGETWKAWQVRRIPFVKLPYILETPLPLSMPLTNKP